MYFHPTSKVAVPAKNRSIVIKTTVDRSPRISRTQSIGVTEMLNSPNFNGNLSGVVYTYRERARRHISSSDRSDSIDLPDNYDLSLTTFCYGKHRYLKNSLERITFHCLSGFGKSGRCGRFLVLPFHINRDSHRLAHCVFYTTLCYLLLLLNIYNLLTDSVLWITVRESMPSESLTV